jgi:hypothetical protein
MGRALEAVRTRDLDGLFGFFGLEVEPGLLEQHREQIARRFAAEVLAIVRLCAGLRERERFTIVREALRMSYDSATLRAGGAAPGPTAREWPAHAAGFLGP